MYERSGMFELRKEGDEVKTFIVSFHCFLECMYLLIYFRIGRHESDVFEGLAGYDSSSSVFTLHLCS